MQTMNVQIIIRKNFSLAIYMHTILAYFISLLYIQKLSYQYVMWFNIHVNHVLIMKIN